MLAAGQIDLVVEANLKAYDIAALVPLVKDAGGIISDWQGNPVNVLDTGNGQVIAAGCAKIHQEALALLNGS
jgi:myo-inositol-1(or 4)-monophosphatase